jgi:predicted TIM-barrel fold metal-dependent hydrolase
MGGGDRYIPKVGTKPVTYKVISSDSHVVEPPDLWTARAQKQFRDRVIQIESHEDGDWYYCDGNRILGLGLGGTQAGMRFDKDKKAEITIGKDLHFDDVRPGGYDPDERMKDLDLDGIDIDVVYPTVGLVAWRVILDPFLLNETCRVYNDWVHDFCSAHPDRLKGIAMLNVDSIEEGVKELKRSQKMGFVGVMIPSKAPAGRPYSLPEYEPLWATAEDLGLPIGLHLATERYSYAEGITTTIGTHIKEGITAAATPDPGFAGNGDMAVRPSISQIVMSGVCDRHPNIQIGAVEFNAAWAAYQMWAMDKQYMEARLRKITFSNDAVPSDYFRRNLFFGYQEDILSIQFRYLIGVENLHWGSDYPHVESTFPESRRVLAEIMEGVPEDEQALIAGKNVERIYHL